MKAKILYEDLKNEMKQKCQFDPSVKQKDIKKNNEELKLIYDQLKKNPDMDIN